MELPVRGACLAPYQTTVLGKAYNLTSQTKEVFVPIKVRLVNDRSGKFTLSP